MADGEHLITEGTELVAEAHGLGHNLSVQAGGWIQVGNVITLTPHSAQASNLWMHTPPLSKNLENLELLVDLHQTPNLLADQASLMRLAAQKRLGTIVNILLDKDLRPAYLVDGLPGSCDYASTSSVVVQDESEAIVG